MMMLDASYYEFGPFHLDIVRRRLLRDGTRIPIPAKAFDLLVVLIQNAGQAQSKDQLIEKVWGTVYVTDNNFKVTLRAVRKALGESARDASYIVKTSDGYRFAADVQEVSAKKPKKASLDGPQLADIADSAEVSSLDEVRAASDRRSRQRFKTAIVLTCMVLLLAFGIIILRWQLLGTANNIDISSPLEEGNVIRLTKHLMKDVFPAWSPTSNQVLFVSNHEHTSKYGDIWLVNSDGTNPRRLTIVPDTEFGLQEPVWLGNTGDIVVLETINYWEWLRFELSANPPLPINRQVLDGSSPFFTQLLSIAGGLGGSFLTFSRDGRQVAWVNTKTSHLNCPTQAEVRTTPLVEIAGQNALSSGKVVVSSSFSCNFPPAEQVFRRISFSPDGLQIVVARNLDENTFSFDLEIYNLDGTLVRRLTDNAKNPAPIINWNPNWSADNRIAFASNRTGRFEIYIINPDGSGLRQVTLKGGDWPSWSPDNKRIAFESNRDGNQEIYTIDISQ